VCGTVPLRKKQPMHMDETSHVLIWKMNIQVFQCSKLLSTLI